jgi:hypothetical protein
MNNQAAQTMPELAADDPIIQMRMVVQTARANDALISRAWVSGWADQWEAERAAAMLAAAPAASGGEPHTDALPDGTLSKSTAKRVEALACASVSERARESVAMELLTNIKRSCKRGRNVADPIKDKSYVESCDHIEDLAQQAIRQIEILSNRPSESTVKRLRDAIDGECDGLGITEESAESILRYIGFHPQGRIVGGREIDGVWVIEATSHSELMPNQQLVRYDDYRAALEQALTQQRVCATCGGRGEIGGHVGQTAETFDYVTEPCPECTTPQPSADAVRELVEALQVAELALRERGLRACGEYKQIAAAIAKASNHQQNAAQGGGEK